MGFYSLHWWLLSFFVCLFTCSLVETEALFLSFVSFEVENSCSGFLGVAQKLDVSPSTFSLHPHKLHFACLGQCGCSENEMKGSHRHVSKSLPIQNDKSVPIDFFFLCPPATISNSGSCPFLSCLLQVRLSLGLWVPVHPEKDI